MATLERIQLTNKTLPQLTDEVRQEAEELFRKDPRYSTSTTVKPGDNLCAALRDLGITPINPAQVRRYKAKHERVEIVFDAWQKMCLIAGSVLGAAALWLFYSLMRSHQLKGEGFWWMAVLCGIAATVMVCMATGSDHYKITWSWRADSFVDYYNSDKGAGVPEFVLERAILVKRALPAVSLKVEYLQDDRERVTGFLNRFEDPFLVVESGRSKHYIDVWEEADFERTI